MNVSKGGITDAWCQERLCRCFDGQHEGDALVLIQNGKKFLTNVSYHMKNGFAECNHLNFDLLPDSYEGDITLVRAKDCAASAKIVKEIK